MKTGDVVRFRMTSAVYVVGEVVGGQPGRLIYRLHRVADGPKGFAPTADAHDFSSSEQALVWLAEIMRADEVVLANALEAAARLVAMVPDESRSLACQLLTATLQDTLGRPEPSTASASTKDGSRPRTSYDMIRENADGSDD